LPLSASARDAGAAAVRLAHPPRAEFSARQKRQRGRLDAISKPTRAEHKKALVIVLDPCKPAVKLSAWPIELATPVRALEML
jgi:hypothetical protein